MKDVLVELLEKNIQRSDLKLDNEDQLIHQTTADYIYHLMCMGNIPQRHLDDIEDIIKEELKDIYKKLTYGSFNLDEYRGLKKPTARRRTQ